MAPLNRDNLFDNNLSDDALPQSFWQGVEAFQQGEFYACHDTLEALWIEAQEPDKTFFQGILQIAVACYHLGNQNWRGAVILLGEGSRRLVSYRPEYKGIDVEALASTSIEFLTYLQNLGPERVGEVSYVFEHANLLQNNIGSAPAVPTLRRWRF